MRVLVIEDELAAAQVLEKLIKEFIPEADVVCTPQTVEESIEWLATNDMPDLTFMDIHLADGSSFSIFEQINISCPIIFTTAYDQYALRAFEVNSVDYLLKPIDKERFKKAILKFQNLNKSTQIAEENKMLIDKLLFAMNQGISYKSALLIPVKDKLIPLSVKKIAYIYTENKIVYAVDFNQHKICLDQTLDELYSQFDPKQFYRVNRQYIISRDAVNDVSIWFNRRLLVNLSVKTPERITVSRLNSKSFKDWLMT